MKLKAKYKLHATKVDRIAIVDRPAVPNANILVFKRFGSDAKDKVAIQMDKFLKSAFPTSFLYSAIDSAVSALEYGIAEITYEAKPEELDAKIADLFAQFSEVIFKLKDIGASIMAEKGMGMVGMDVPASSQDVSQSTEYPTTDEVVARFEQESARSAIRGAICTFRSYLSWLCCPNKMPNADEAMQALIDSLEAYVTETAQEVVVKGLSGKDQTLEKEGRIISTRRMAKLKDMHNLLGDIIKEADTKAMENRRRRGGMKIMDKAQEDALIETLKGIGEKLGTLEGRLVIIEAKAEKEAGIDKAIVDAQASLKFLTETIEAVKNAHDSAIKPVQEGLKPLAEKALKLEADLAVEKSAREALEERLAKNEKAMEAFQASINTVGKRLGVRTSVEGVVEKSDKTEGDVFGDAVRGKTAKA